MALNYNNFTLILLHFLHLVSILVVVNASDPEFASLLDMVTGRTDPEIYDESSFSYVPGAPDGPENWGNLNPNWTLCGTGTMQSPIKILDSKVVLKPKLGRLIRNYQSAPALIRNRGHDIQVAWTEDAGGIVINDDEFKLLQCHWHTPSEHKLNIDRFCMELHLVHTNSEGDIAVIGILYQLGAPDPFLTYLSPFLQSATTEGTDIGILSPYRIRFPGPEYYRYNGSLTTPPCSENVTWTVMRTTATVSMDQILALKNAIHDGAVGNARPIQHSRTTVYLYQPSLISEM